MPEHFELKKKGVAVRGLVGAGGRHCGALLSTLWWVNLPWLWSLGAGRAPLTLLWGTVQGWQRPKAT